MKYFIIALLGVLSFQVVHAQQSLSEIEQHLRQKIEECLVKVYEGQPTAYAEYLADDVVMPEHNLRGKDMIYAMLETWDIPPTDYTVEFFPLVQVDSTYFFHYEVNETSGYKISYVEQWANDDNELKIKSLSIIASEPAMQTSGIGKTRFLISSFGLGIALFLLLMIYKKAIAWKGK